MNNALENLVQKKELENLEAIHLDRKIAEYRQRINTGNFSLHIKWQTDLSKMDFGELKTKTIARVLKKLPDDFEVVTLELEKVISHHTTIPDKLFPKNNLWKVREPRNTARLIEFVEQGNKLIPPIIRVHNNHTLVIIDGHYRIALCRYLGLKRIPFLIRKKFLPNTVELR